MKNEEFTAFQQKYSSFFILHSSFFSTFALCFIVYKVKLSIDDSGLYMERELVFL